MSEKDQQAGQSEQPQTVTQFAAEHGTVDAGSEGVQETIRQEQEAAQQGTERAERVSEALAGEDAGPVPPEEGGGSA